MSDNKSSGEAGVKLTELLTEAMAVEQAEGRTSEMTKLGTLRGGNSGAVHPTSGRPVGACPRLAHLRSIGIEMETADDSTLTMWENGHVNETYWVDKLKRVWDGPILCESDIPVSWFSADGTPVTGRPDLVLMREERGTPITAEEARDINGTGPQHMEVGYVPLITVPVLGLELKSLSSVWTVEKCSLGKKTAPKMDHLCQAGHYSWQLGEKYNLGGPLPYRIIYSAHVNFSGPDWIGKMMGPDTYDMTGVIGNHPVIELGKDGKFKNTRPHHVVYELAWDLIYEDGHPGNPKDGQLKFRREGADTYTMSPVTWSGIQKYYEWAGEKIKTEMPPRPLTLKGDGSAANFSLCEARYCPLSETCDNHEKKGYNQWLQAVRRLK